MLIEDPGALSDGMVFGKQIFLIGIDFELEGEKERKEGDDERNAKNGLGSADNKPGSGM